MISERLFAKLYDLNPFLFPKLSSKKLPNSTKLCVLSVEICSFFTLCVDFNNVKVKDIQSFTHLLDVVYRQLSFLLNSWCVFTIDQLEAVSIEDFDSLDELLGSHLPSCSYNSVIYFWLIVIPVTRIFSTKWIAPRIRFVLFLDLLLTAFTIYQASSVKFMISKRMEALVDKAGASEDVLELLGVTRALMQRNDRVALIYGTRVGSLLGASASLFIYSLSAYWRLYGLHVLDDSYESRAPILNIFAHGNFIVEVFFMGFTSTRVNNFVELVSWELMRKSWRTDYSIEYRERLIVFMQELTHAFTGFKALDLLEVNSASITHACGFVVFCMMIFIQFMTTS